MPSHLIAPQRNRIQSRVLVTIVLPCLILAALRATMLLHTRPSFILFPILSLTFAGLVWVLRAATPFASIAGGVITYLVLLATARLHAGPLHSALPALIVLFLLTFAATRAGRGRKVAAGLAEDRRGRNTAQIVANLGCAGLIAACAFIPGRPTSYLLPTLILAALAEATADTVSSEIGQAFGGSPLLLTTFRRVPPGTDGAVTLLGTVAGLAAASLVIITAMPALSLPPRAALVVFAAATAGLFFDTILGATLESGALLNNDWVNFLSTASATVIASLLR